MMLTIPVSKHDHNDCVQKIIQLARDNKSTDFILPRIEDLELIDLLLVELNKPENADVVNFVQFTTQKSGLPLISEINTISCELAFRIRNERGLDIRG
jgi:hypothetical protein